MICRLWPLRIVSLSLSLCWLYFHFSSVSSVVDWLVRRPITGDRVLQCVIQRVRNLVDSIKLLVNLSVSWVQLLLQLDNALVFEVVVVRQLLLELCISLFEHLHKLERLLLLHCHLLLQQHLQHSYGIRRFCSLGNNRLTHLVPHIRCLSNRASTKKCLLLVLPTSILVHKLRCSCKWNLSDRIGHLPLIVPHRRSRFGFR